MWLQVITPLILVGVDLIPDLHYSMSSTPEGVCF